MPIKTATLNVPGADLYHEVRGAGPALVMMPRGPADAWVVRDNVFPGAHTRFDSHSAEFAVKLREVLEGV